MPNESPEWTVLTWNVLGSAKPDLGHLADAIRAEAPDVVVLQEVRKSQAEKLARLLQFKFTWALKHNAYSRALWWRAEGLAIMSPHTIGAPGHTELSDHERLSSWRRRIALWALIARDDSSELRIYNLHLSPHDAAQSRRQEAVRLARVLFEHGDVPPAVVAGDFNDADDPNIIYALPGIEHIVPADSSPAAAPTQLLDHVLMPPTAHGVAASVPAGGPGWAELSDHLPVTVRFRF